jgi:hypothetical protein
MTKDEFFQEIESIKSDQLLITDSVNNIKEEIAENCWSISMTDEIAANCSPDELSKFLRDVKEDRRRQLIQSNSGVGLIYYIWVDEMAGQLRFNFINSNHNKLPFWAALIFVDTEHDILSDYLLRRQINSERVRVYRELITV